MCTRALDVLLSGAALLCLFPFLCSIALLLRFSGEGEVFFRQERVGKAGQLFGLLKFATMQKNSPNIGAGLLTLKNDPRVLPVGRFLRRTKLNEVPQLYNVLRGDMSLIGPRPQTPRHFAVFPEHVKAELVEVRPGLSGIGSIVFRDEETLLSQPGRDPERYYAEVIAPHKGELELWFIRRQGLWLYLALIGLTLWAIVWPGDVPCHAIFRDLPAPPPEPARSA
jgi:lipopolysaccharide/colanic/teichoic acid biosynthesis glycosyltransferase